MSDARIHLRLHLAQAELLGVERIFPNIEYVTEEYYDLRKESNEIVALEALVRSLAGDPIQYKKCPFCDDTWSLDMIAKALNRDNCLKGGNQEFRWSDQPIITEKNKKIKVTFGAGTWVHTCRKTCITPHITTKLELPKEIIEKQIIESLQPLEKACHELGIEVEYQ